MTLSTEALAAISNRVRGHQAAAVRNNVRPNWFKISNAEEAAADGEPVQVLIYGEIGDSWFSDSVPASAFVRALADIDTDAAVDFHIHSPGGDVFDGLAIATAIRSRKGKTTAYVDGLAASAASYIAVAADEVVMAVGAELMIHDAWGFAMGNAADMQKMADDLAHISGNIASLYAEKAGGDVTDWRELMLAETWYTADEAVAAGLADRVDRKRQADAKNAFDLTIFAHAGRRDAPPPPTPLSGAARDHTPPARPADPTTHTEGVAVSDTLNQGLRERLGISADDEIDEAGILAALDGKLTKPEPKNAVPEGMVLVEADVLTGLQNSARLGVEAREQQIAEARERSVQDALADGRISPARADHWREQLKADPGAVEVLNGLPKNLVPVEALGYAGGPDEHGDDDAYPSSWKR